MLSRAKTGDVLFAARERQQYQWKLTGRCGVMRGTMSCAAMWTMCIAVMLMSCPCQTRPSHHYQPFTYTGSTFNCRPTTGMGVESFSQGLINRTIATEKQIEVFVCQRKCCVKTVKHIVQAWLYPCTSMQYW